MRIPDRNIGGWAKQIVDLCSASQEDRLQRGQIFRNIYLTGDETGKPATYPKTFAYIDNLSSYLYSPVELKFNIEQYGWCSNVDRAMMRTASSELHKRLRQANVDTGLQEVVTWALVKGKTFQKLLWTGEGFQPSLIQPEMMGVLREDLPSLNDQDAFYHLSYLTPDRFAEMVSNNPDRIDLMRKAEKYMNASRNGKGVANQSHIKQVILGGLNPYQIAGQGNSTTQRAWVNWISGPMPTLNPDVIAKLIPVYELWVWDDDRGEEGEWTTIQFVGEDCVIEGKYTHRNVFADQYDPSNMKKSTKPTDRNPLYGKHPFVEICPNTIDGYFWGRSEICNVALLQTAINKRMDGINSLLRRQEDPPVFMSGVTGMNQSAFSKFKKPGSYLTDANPGAKLQTLGPELPSGLWESLHELEALFNDMAGFAPVLQGRGESGVRAQGHAETLVRTASPRFKDRALMVERQVEEMGGLALDMLKAHIPQKMTTWVQEKDAGIYGKIANENWLEEPPIPGMKPIDFLLYNLPLNCKVVVDSHSSSPAFSHDTRSLLFDLFKAGAIKLDQLVTHTHPPGEDSIVQDIHRAEIEKEKFLAEHPEAALKSSGKKK